MEIFTTFRGNTDSLLVGAGEGQFGLWLDSSLFQGRSQTCSTYRNRPLVSGGGDFVVKTLECWTFEWALILLRQEPTDLMKAIVIWKSNIEKNILLFLEWLLLYLEITPQLLLPLMFWWDWIQRERKILPCYILS